MNKPIQHIENKPYLFNDFGEVKILYPERTARSAELDEETGLYYYGARYYEPRISLWLSVDPLVGAKP
ncbi:MAG: RHS repeat-associated core domain-containing protein [Flavobacteriales bacterium]